MLERVPKIAAGAGRFLGRGWVLFLLMVAGGLTAGAFISRSAHQGPDSFAYAFEPGERWRHQFRFAGAGSVDLSALTSGPNAVFSGQPAQSVRTIVEGELVTDILARTERRVLLAYSIPKSKVALFVGDLPLIEGETTIEKDLMLPVLVEVDLQGRVQTLRFAPQVSDLSRNCVRAILAATQVALPTESDASDVWEAWEQSTQGRCRAVYQTDPEAPSGAISLIKTREEYERPATKEAGADRLAAVTYHPDGALRIVFDPALGLVRSIEGTETLIMKVEGKVLSASQNSIALDFAGKETIAAPELDLLVRMAKERARSVPAETLAAATSNRTDGQLIQKQTLGDATFESLRDDLARAEADTAGTTDQTPLYLKIKALIAVHPETSARWAELASSAAPESLTLRLVPAALAAVGNDQSQAALIALMKARESDEAMFTRLLTILGQVKAPSELTENTMRDFAHRSRPPSIAPLAQLSLGNMARNLHEGAPARADKIVAWAVDELNAAPSESAKAHWLLVLGNAGAVQALPVIAAQLANLDADVRSAAASALRFIATDEAQALLLQTMKTDTDPEVRRAALTAFRYRPMSKVAFQAEREAMQSDQSADVRLAAMNLLWEVKQQFPEVISLVQNAAANDEASPMREAASRLLGSASKGE